MYSRKFSFRCIAYQEKDHFVGVCLDLDIVEEAKTLDEAVKRVNDAILSHLLSAAEVGFPDELLNRPAWEKLSISNKNSRVYDSTIRIF